MKPLFKWSGGKSKEIKLFSKFYPEYDLYIEPFFGGGAVYFDIAPKKAVIADVHTEMITFLKEMKKGNGKKIYDLMKQYPNDEKTYYYVRRELNINSDLLTAFRFFYLRKTCYRGMLRYNRKGQFNIPFGRYKTYNYEILLDEKYEKLLSNTDIYLKDFNYIFDNYNSKNNFVFLDPPYDSEFTDYGYCKFGKDKQIELAKRFKETKNKCLMIIGKTDFIEKLYSGYIYGSYDKKYAFKIHSGRIGAEIDNQHLIIKNF